VEQTGAKGIVTKQGRYAARALVLAFHIEHCSGKQVKEK